MAKFNISFNQISLEIHYMWGQNGVKLKIKKGANPHFGSILHEKTPEIDDFKCHFGCGGGI